MNKARVVRTEIVTTKKVWIEVDGEGDWNAADEFMKNCGYSGTIIRRWDGKVWGGEYKIEVERIVRPNQNIPIESGV